MTPQKGCQLVPWIRISDTPTRTRSSPSSDHRSSRMREAGLKKGPHSGGVQVLPKGSKATRDPTSPPPPVEVTYPAEACTSGLKTMYIRPDLACTLRVLEVSARVRLAPRSASSDYPERSTPRKIGGPFSACRAILPRRHRLDPLGSKAINTSTDPAGPAIRISSSGDEMKCCQGCLTLT